MDGLGIVAVLLPLAAHLVAAHRGQSQIHRQPQGVIGLGVLGIGLGGDVLQGDAANAADGSGKIGVDDFPADADALKNLAALVGLDGGNAHFRGDLHDPLEDGVVVVLHGGVVVLMQQPVLHQLGHRGVGQVGVDGAGAVAQQTGEVVHLPGLPGLQNEGHGRALLGLHQVLVHRRHRQQGRDGYVVFVHPTVGQDQDGGPLAVGLVHLDKQLLQHPVHGGIFIVKDGDRGHLEAGAVHGLDLQQVQVVQNGVVDFQHPAVLRLLLEQIAVFPGVDGGGGDDFLPHRVDGRVGHLGEHLLEVVKQGLILVGEHRQRGVHTHGPNGLAAVEGHGAYAVAVLLIGIAEGHLQPGAVLPAQRGHRLVGNLQVVELHQVAVQPLPVGLLPGVPFLDLLVRVHPALHGIHQQHLPGVQPLLGDDLVLRDGEHSHLRGENEPPVTGDIVAGGAQAVAVQHRPHHITVGEENGGGAVPGLHHGGVVLVEVPEGLGDGVVVAPGLGDGHHHRQRQLHAAHDQKLQGVVQHGRVGAVGVDHRQHLGQVVLREGGGGHGLLPGLHLVGVAPDGVDLPVVDDEAVGVGPLPAGVGVGGEAGVHQGNSRVEVLILQIHKEGAQLPHQEHPLIDHGAAGQRGHIGVVVALLEDPAHHVQLSVKGQPRRDVLGLFHKALVDGRHTRQGLLPQHLRGGGHWTPTQKLQPLLAHNDFEHLHGPAALQFILGKEEHANAVFPLPAQSNAQLGTYFGEKAVADLNQNANAVPGLPLGIFSGPVFQVFHNVQGICHNLMGFPAVDVHNGPDAAVVMLQLRAV